MHVCNFAASDMPSRSKHHFNAKKLAPFCRQYLNGTILQKIIYLLDLIHSDLRQYPPPQLWLSTDNSSNYGSADFF